MLFSHSGFDFRTINNEFFSIKAVYQELPEVIIIDNYDILISRREIEYEKLNI